MGLVSRPANCLRRDTHGAATAAADLPQGPGAGGWPLAWEQTSKVRRRHSLRLKLNNTWFQFHHSLFHLRRHSLFPSAPVQRPTAANNPILLLYIPFYFITHSFISPSAASDSCRYAAATSHCMLLATGAAASAGRTAATAGAAEAALTPAVEAAAEGIPPPVLPPLPLPPSRAAAVGPPRPHAPPPSPAPPGPSRRASASSASLRLNSSSCRSRSPCFLRSCSSSHSCSRSANSSYRQCECLD